MKAGKILIGIWLCIGTILNGNTVLAQNGVPQIVINPKGHSARINNILYTPDGTQIISISEDKTIRLWDVETGEMIKKYETQIGDGSEGMLYASSLSPNGRLLAVAGYPVSSEESNYIVIIDLNRDQQVATAVGHKNVINGLGFSGDGKFLISGDDDGIIKCWEVSRSKMYKEVSQLELGSPVFDLSINANKSIAAVASAGKEVILVDFSSVSTSGKMSVKSLKKHKSAISKVKFSPDGKFLASCSVEDELILWTGDGVFQFLKDDYEVPLNALAFSYDSKILVALDLRGRGFSYAIPNGNLYTKDFKGHDNVVFSATFSPRSTDGNYVIASAGGTRNEIVLWNAISAKETKRISGRGNFIGNIAFGSGKELYIAPSFTSKSPNYSYLFDFQSLSLSQNDSKPAATAIDKLNKNISIGNDLLSVVLPKGKVIYNDEFEDGYVRSFTSTADGKVVVGSDFSLKMYDGAGNLLKELVGHTGGVWSLSASADGRYVASGSDDQTIKLWKVDESGYAPSIEQFFSTEDDILEIVKSLETDQTAIESKKAWQNTIQIIREAGDKKLTRFFEDYYNGLGEAIIPFGNLFVANDNQWVYWAPTGYFACSEKGADYFGWHLNNGIEQLADFYSADQYFELLYRPDVMSKSVSMYRRAEDILKADGEQIFDLSKLSKPSAGLFDLTELTVGALKVLDYDKGKYLTTESHLKLSVEVFDGGGGIREINLYQNGKLLLSDTDAKSLQSDKIKKRSYEVDLVNETNNFKLVVVNYQGIESRPDYFKVDYVGEEIVTTNLHILAIGINRYEREDYNLNYAYDDAHTFTKKFVDNSTPLFKNVRNRIELYDEEATRDNILKSFESIISQAKPEDMFVFYYAGHGTIDESAGNEYYLVPPNITQLYGDSKQLKEKGISATELKMLLSKIKATKQLILMDACHSGAAIDKLQENDAERERAMTQLARSSGVAMLTSSNSQQFATEFEVLKHGVFTYSLLDALDGAADTGDKVVSVYEMKLFMERMVPKISKEYGGVAQKPVAHVFGNDFSISIVAPNTNEANSDGEGNK